MSKTEEKFFTTSVYVWLAYMITFTLVYLFVPGIRQTASSGIISWGSIKIDLLLIASSIVPSICASIKTPSHYSPVNEHEYATVIILVSSFWYAILCIIKLYWMINYFPKDIGGFVLSLFLGVLIHIIPLGIIIFILSSLSHDKEMKAFRQKHRCFDCCYIKLTEAGCDNWCNYKGRKIDEAEDWKCCDGYCLKR